MAHQETIYCCQEFGGTERIEIARYFLIYPLWQCQCSIKIDREELNLGRIRELHGVLMYLVVEKTDPSYYE